MAQVICENSLCKHHSNEKNVCIKKRIKLDCSGDCTSYEKSFHYYFNLVWQKFIRSNMILANDLTPDLRIGLFYVMDILDLCLCTQSRGFWQFQTLVRKDDPESQAVNYEDIKTMVWNREKLNFHAEKFNSGILPPYEPIEEKPKPKVEFQPFGYLSPDGNFVEGDWGTHEELAFKIIEDNGWTDEYKKFHVDSMKNKESNYAKNFLIKNKGFVLIHDPCNFDYIVVKKGTLTKEQNDFLYQYFMDMGNDLAAKCYLPMVDSIKEGV